MRSMMRAQQTMQGYSMRCHSRNIILRVVKVFTSAPNYISTKANRISVRKAHTMDNYNKIRTWQKVFEKENEIIDLDDSFIFKVLCFNILAQDLLVDHPYLYRNHDRDALRWENRKQLLVQEILRSEAHVICLQEVQKDHLDELLEVFEPHGFSHLYKKRTHEKTDGLLILYKKDLFNVLDFSKIEFYQNGIGLLNRDNVGLIAKFSLKKSPETKFVVANTHLLYNPRRSDIRLGQVQLLLAEIERMAFVEYNSKDSQYLPIILTGDFNLQPFSPVYKFVNDGRIEFAGKDKNLEPCDYNGMSNCLIPPRLYITDNCLHYNVLVQRLTGSKDAKVMLEHTEYQYSNPGEDDSSEQSKEKSMVNCKTKALQTMRVAEGHYVTFSSGYLTHPFKFQSVYSHVNKIKEKEATTHHDSWITTDYIFYSKMKLLERFNLPTADECVKYFPTIPDSAVGSDHFCLGATFLLRET